jgi:SAM-dependent methyltransferase|tara:strand:+ start:27 stop:1118 length:1092 start_codon:yes stop_codon:yes gene_type:complete
MSSRPSTASTTRPKTPQITRGAHSSKLFGTVNYWDTRYSDIFYNFKELPKAEQKEKGIEYDWYVDRDQACDIIVPYLEMFRGISSRVLIVGCGLSGVGPELYRRGFKNVVNIDFSQTVIARMQKEYADHEGLQFSVLDVSNLGSFGDNYFDFVFDKGCLDAVMCSNSSVQAVHGGYTEISRVLADQGYYLSVSHAEPSCRNPYLKKDDFKWVVSSTKVTNETGDQGFYIFSCRKDLDKFRPAAPPMALLPCLEAKGYQDSIETFQEADVFSVEAARKLSKLQLVLLGIPEDDCPELMEHIAAWAGSETEMKKRRKMERKRQRALKRQAKGGPMVLSSDDSDDGMNSSTQEDSSSEESDSDDDA